MNSIKLTFAKGRITETNNGGKETKDFEYSIQIGGKKIFKVLWGIQKE